MHLLFSLCELYSEPHLTEFHMAALASLIRDLDREMTSAHSGIYTVILHVTIVNSYFQSCNSS